MKKTKENFFKKGWSWLAAVCGVLMLVGAVLLQAGQQKNAVSAYASEEGVSDFVSRLYTVILERTPDEAGLAEWTGYLKDGTFTGTEVAKGFIMSEEFLNKDMEHEEFVQILYSAFFGREADPEGLAGWVDYLERGYRKSYIFSGFANSVEFDALCDSYGVEAGFVPVTVSEQQPNLTEEEYNTWLFVERMYTEVLTRTPAVQEIKDWAGFLQDGSFTGAEVASGFILSKEFQTKPMTNEVYVKIMYKAFFGREADPEGLAGWVNALETEYSKEFVFAGFANSGEFGTLCENYGIIQGEVEVPEVTPTPEPTGIPTGIPSPTPSPTPVILVGDNYRIENYTMTLFGLDEITETLEDGTDLPDLISAYGVTKVVIEEGVTEIGSSAFKNCKKLVSVELPDSLKKIGSKAFERCASLVSIVIPEEITELEYVFRNCTALTSVVLPDNLQTLKSTFSGCTALREIELPEHVKEIDGAFSGCTGLKRIVIPETVRNMDGTFEDCTSLQSVNIPERVMELDGTFEGCTSLTSIKIPGRVTTLEGTFRGCTNLTTVELPDSLITIGSSTFKKCSSLTELILPENVEEIGGYAFEGCRGLTSFTYPLKVKKADVRAFKDCSALTSITFSANISAFTWSSEDGIFGGCESLSALYAPAGSYAEEFLTEEGFEVLKPVYDEAITYIISGKTLYLLGKGKVKALLNDGTELAQLINDQAITKVVFDEGITAIGNAVFMRCSSLLEVEFSDTITEIGYNAFNGCTGLTQVVLPDSITSMDYGVFYGCSALKKVKLPNQLAFLGDGAFCFCSSLEQISLPDSLKEILENTFNACTALAEINLPVALKNIGKNAFEDCVSLETLSLPDTVERIDNWAFSGCDSLRRMNLPESIEFIGEDIFEECFAMEKVYLVEDSYADEWYFAECENDCFKLVYNDGTLPESDEDDDGGSLPGEDDGDSDDGDAPDDGEDETEDDEYTIIDDSDEWAFKGILLYAQNGVYPKYTDSQVKKLATELGDCAYIINSGEVYNWTYGNNTPIIQTGHINTLSSETMRNEYLGYLSKPSYNMLEDYADSAMALAREILSYNPNARIYFTLPGMRYKALAAYYEDAYRELIEYIRDEMGSTLWSKNVEGFYIGTEDAVEQWYINFNYNVQRDFEAQTMKVIKNLDNDYFSNIKKLIWIPFIGVDDASDTRLERIGYVADYSNLFDYIILQSGATFAEGKGKSVEASLENAQLIVDSSLKNRMYNRTGKYITPSKPYDTVIGFELEYSPEDNEWRAGSSQDAYDECLDMIGDNKGEFPIVYYMGGPNEFDAAFDEVKSYLVNHSDEPGDESGGNDGDGDDSDDDSGDDGAGDNSGDDIFDDDQEEDDIEVGTIEFDNDYEEAMDSNTFTLSWSDSLTAAQRSLVKYTVIQAYKKEADGSSVPTLNQQVNSYCVERVISLPGGMYGFEVTCYDKNMNRLATGQTRVSTPQTISGFRIGTFTEGNVAPVYGTINTIVPIESVTCVIKDNKTGRAELSATAYPSAETCTYSVYGSALDNKLTMQNLTPGTKTAVLTVLDNDGEELSATIGFVVLEKPVSVVTREQDIQNNINGFDYHRFVLNEKVVLEGSYTVEDEWYTAYSYEDIVFFVKHSTKELVCDKGLLNKLLFTKNVSMKLASEKKKVNDEWVETNELINLLLASTQGFKDTWRMVTQVAATSAYVESVGVAIPSAFTGGAGMIASYRNYALDKATDIGSYMFALEMAGAYRMISNLETACEIVTSGGITSYEDAFEVMSTVAAVGDALEMVRVAVLEDLNYNNVNNGLDKAVWWVKTTLNGFISGMGGMLDEAGKTAAKTLTKNELMLRMAELKACGLLIESSAGLVDGLLTGNFKVGDALTLTVQKVFDNNTAVQIGTNIVSQFTKVIEKSQNNGFGWITAYLEKYCYRITDAGYTYSMDNYILLDDIMEEAK